MEENEKSGEGGRRNSRLIRLLNHTRLSALDDITSLHTDNHTLLSQNSLRARSYGGRTCFTLDSNNNNNLYLKKSLYS